MISMKKPIANQEQTHNHNHNHNHSHSHTIDCRPEPETGPETGPENEPEVFSRKFLKSERRMPADSIARLAKAKWSIVGGFIVLAGLQGCGLGGAQDSSGDSSNGGICVAAADFGEIFTESGQARGGALSADDRVLRGRTVTVNLEMFKRAGVLSSGQDLRLNLFADRSIEIEIEKIERPGPENVVISGHLKDDELSHVSLVVRNQVMVANVRIPESGENFEIRHLGEGLHEIREIRDLTDNDCLAVPSDEFDSSADVAEASDRVLSDPVIDILAAYTPNARIAEGGTDGIIALIQMGVADTNSAFAASGVALSVRLVGTLEVAQNESSFSSDLTALKSKTDGKWDEVHPLRASLGADQVSMVGYYSGTSTAGIGYISASESSAFTVTRTSAFSQYTFSHELGHNLGLQHEDGYENVAGRFRTIMAYGSYPRIRRYSNPSLTYNSYATSDGAKNSASILNANSVRVSNLLDSIVPIAPGDSPGDTSNGSIACDR